MTEISGRRESQAPHKIFSHRFCKYSRDSLGLVSKACMLARMLDRSCSSVDFF